MALLCARRPARLRVSVGGGAESVEGRVSPSLSPAGGTVARCDFSVHGQRRRGGLKRSAELAGPARQGKRRKVLFDTVEVREMLITVSDSAVPCDGGPPIGISAQIKRSVTHSLDCFELERETGRRLKTSVGSPLPQRMGKERFQREGRLPVALRRAMLARARARADTIATAEAQTRLILRGRDDSNRAGTTSTGAALAAMDAAAAAAGAGAGAQVGRVAGALTLPEVQAQATATALAGELASPGLSESDSIAAELEAQRKFYGVLEFF
jgi:hypothetical protein